PQRPESVLPPLLRRSTVNRLEHVVRLHSRGQQIALRGRPRGRLPTIGLGRALARQRRQICVGGAAPGMADQFISAGPAGNYL
ncbi:MAG: hypothetical protein CMK78_09315, partial [Pseudomonadales bacterium]|nr:hypothetical protein [Pseudomonadales bacterium]